MEDNFNLEDDEEIVLEFKPILSAKQRKAIGHNAERFIRLYFINTLKQEFCQTSRNNSKFLDKCGVDFDNVPMRVQLKAGVQADLKPIKELIYIHNQCQKFLPPDSVWLSRLKVLIHHKNNTKGKSGKTADGFTYIYMTDMDFTMFLTIANVMVDGFTYKTYRNKEQSGSEFDNMVRLDFSTFTELFLKAFPPQLNPNKDVAQNKKRGS